MDTLKKISDFAKRIFKVFAENELFTLANEMTYRLLLAFFPFLIFLMTVVGFINIDSGLFLHEIAAALPDEVYSLVETFVSEVIEKRNTGLLSTSLLLSVFTASNAFDTIIRGINKVHRVKDGRSFLRRRVISVFHVLVFTVFIILALSALILGGFLYDVAVYYLDIEVSKAMVSYLSVIAAVIVLLVGTAIIYKTAYFGRIGIRDILPGACLTVSLWVLSSVLFGFFVNNFTRYSVIYGSIGSIFVFVLWLNIISVFFLAGVQVNAARGAKAQGISNKE